MNISENQTLPKGIHNRLKSFRPNMATVQMLSLGTKSLPEWKFDKKNNAFKINLISLGE